MSKIYILIGPPGSGKSTFIKKKMQDFNVVSRDEIRFSMLNENDDYFSKEKEVFNKFIANIVDILKRDEDVIVDATHITKASRTKLMNAIKRNISSFNSEMIAIVMKTPLDMCKKQNNLREGKAKVPDDVIENMYNKMQLPSFKEGFTVIYNIFLNPILTDNYSILKVTMESEVK